MQIFLPQSRALPALQLPLQDKRINEGNNINTNNDASPLDSVRPLMVEYVEEKKNICQVAAVNHINFRNRTM